MGTLTGSEILARALQAQGMDTLFFLMGGPMLETESELVRIGSALLGAMACGLPVVATASGGVPEIVDERNGLLVADFRAEGFAAALARLLSDADFAKRLGTAGRESILQHFTADAMVAKTLRLYDKLIPGSSHA